jgi:two-component system sensor histidine kinase/response regulator
MWKNTLKYFQVQWTWLVGDPEKFTIENRIFHAFCIFAIVTNCVETTFNVFNDLYSSVFITVFIAMFQIACYFISRFKNKGTLAVVLSAIEINILTGVSFFYNSGVTGSTLLLFIVTLFILILIVQPKQWLLWYSINLIIVLSMVILEYYRPGVIQVHYNNRKAMFIDMGLAYVIVATLIFVCTIQMRKKYREQVMLTEEKAVKLQLLHNEKDKLFTIISHDLNAPIAALKQYFILLNSLELEQSERASIEQDLVKSVDNTQELLHNLLQWSKSQMKEVVVDLQELSLQKVLQSTLDTFYQIALSKEMELIVDINSAILVTADNNMLQLIARNLVNNAIKFTSANGRIWVKASIDKDFCILSITDNGIGIPVHKQSKIFSLDMQSSPGTTLETGSGLGLLLVKDYTELQHGKIWFTSEPGVGTTFYVSLKGRMITTAINTI